MIKVENISVMNFDNALRGMRNPLESWGQSDSYYDKENNNYVVGENDLKLALKLVKAGSSHSKFMRQIFVSMDITAPMSWWWDVDTYKVGTVKNSTSRMHKLGNRLLTEDDFSWNKPELDLKLYGSIEKSGIMNRIISHRRSTLNYLNDLITLWQKNKDKNLWRAIVDDLPDSYNFLATYTTNYQGLRTLYPERKNHKQYEFGEFCKIVEELPYSKLITVRKENNNEL